MIKKESRNSMRITRHERIRKTIMGTSTLPRLCVFRSNTGIYAQSLMTKLELLLYLLPH